MHTRGLRARSAWLALVLLIGGSLAGGLAACGDGSAENDRGAASTAGEAIERDAAPPTDASAASEDVPADEPATLATAVVLGVAVDLPDTLRQACEQWAQQRSARIEWLDATGDAAALGRATLREIRAPELEALVAGEALRAYGAAGEDTAANVDLVGGLARVGDRGGTTWGLPWRARLHALRAPGALDWAGLARTGADLGLQENRLDEVFLAFAAAAGALDRGSGVLDTEAPAAVEALAFLTRLAARATVTDEATLRDAVAAGELEAVAVDVRLDDAGLPPAHGFPGPTADDPAVVLAHPRLLVLPRGGDHVDLGAELALWLCAPEQAALLARAAPSWIPLVSEVEGADATVLALREKAVSVPHGGSDAVRWNAILDEAVRAAVERRRSPEAALAEARHRREGGE